MAEVTIKFIDLPTGEVDIQYDFGEGFINPETEEDLDKLTKAQQMGGLVAQFLTGLAMQSAANAQQPDIDKPLIIIPGGHK